MALFCAKVIDAIEELVKLGGVYSHNRHFDTFYSIGAQNLPALESEVYFEGATSSTLMESYEDYLSEGWADFIKDFCE